jgi:hypothetical protein
VEFVANETRAAFFGQNPLSVLPRRIVADVAGVAALQIGYPIAALVSMECHNRSFQLPIITFTGRVGDLRARNLVIGLRSNPIDVDLLCLKRDHFHFPGHAGKLSCPRAILRPVGRILSTG